ncbi:MAG: hypothetical protein HRT81_17895 [Henriciella sp.]|nr:hypothetical protein [Henriciella sp.]
MAAIGKENIKNGNTLSMIKTAILCAIALLGMSGAAFSESFSATSKMIRTTENLSNPVPANSIEIWSESRDTFKVRAGACTFEVGEEIYGSERAKMEREVPAEQELRFFAKLQSPKTSPFQTRLPNLQCSNAPQNYFMITGLRNIESRRFLASVAQVYDDNGYVIYMGGMEPDLLTPAQERFLEAASARVALLNEMRK